MFSVIHNSNDDFSFVILQSEDKLTSAKIVLEEGGRLQELILNGSAIIKEIEGFRYKNSYASSVLFPFCSRIENGTYNYNGRTYQLICNDDKNALHGLVYDKKFKVKNISEHSKSSSVTLNYEDNRVVKGFPYKYSIELTYILYKDKIDFSVLVKNIDESSFPFTLGWHPYFFCDNLKQSVLRFQSDRKIVFNDNLITQKVIEEKTKSEFKIENKQLDDCFILNSNTFEFITPKYHIEITTNQLENYLQLYTPKDLPLIAIEPMTGVSNSFNNNIGLQVLKPNQSYLVNWNINLKTKK